MSKSKWWSLEDPHLTETAPPPKSKSFLQRQESEENVRLSALGTGRNSISCLEQESRTHDSVTSIASPTSFTPICRQFWKAGNYDEGLATKSILQNATGYLHIHPKFLHSNATSHKWVFGAIAELLDNAVDEIQRGATSVTLDKIANPKDGNPALLIQDDGGGMDPDLMRRCLSFGFSNKESKFAIGQYGNGFKTSTMRLGSDAIVFTRSMKERKLTQSVGLLSYTSLMQSGYDRVVVPMIDYEFDELSGTWKTLQMQQSFENNISLLLSWSPYTTEAELLNQFDAVGSRGTRIIIFNLWCNDDGHMELDFDSNPEDILVYGYKTEMEKSSPRILESNKHLANRLQYSLRAYLSILYLRIPNEFSMLLRGQVIEYHNIASDLKYPELILYRPYGKGNSEDHVVTAIGFLKDAPHVSIHGFNVYHKNRLILPFWHVVSYSHNNRGRGVVGVLEANFIEPMHNKQEFERTPAFQKLEHRLKQMTLEYWDYHCELIGYQVKKKPRVRLVTSQDYPCKLLGTYKHVLLRESAYAVPNESSARKIDENQVFLSSQTPSRSKRSSNFQSDSHGEPSENRDHDVISDPENVKRKARLTADESVTGSQIEPVMIADRLEGQNSASANLLQENQQLQRFCLEAEKMQSALNNKLNNLMVDLKNAQLEYAHLLVESRALEKVKEMNVGM